MDNSVYSRHGRRLADLGDGVEDGDAVNYRQLSQKVGRADLPTRANVDHFYTQVWSNGGTPAQGDTLPPFCIVNDERVGWPTAVWLAASSSGSGPMSININVNGNNGNTPFSLLVSALVLPAGQNGPVKTSLFINPVPFFGIDSFIVPTIVSVGGQAAVSIGVVVKRQKQAGLI